MLFNACHRKQKRETRRTEEKYFGKQNCEVYLRTQSTEGVEEGT